MENRVKKFKPLRYIVWVSLESSLPAVRIKADREATLGLVVNVVDEIRLSGAGVFSIETEKKGMKD